MLNSYNIDIIHKYIKNNKNKVVFPEINIAFSEAMFSDSRHFVVVYNHSTRQYFISVTMAIESYVYGIWRLLDRARRATVPNELWKSYKDSNKDDWSFEIYKVVDKETYQQLQLAIKKAGFTQEICEESSAHRNSIADYSLFLYTDKETGWKRYATNKTNSKLALITGIRTALISLSYSHYHINKDVRKALKDMYLSIYNNSLSSKKFTIEEIADIPEEYHGLPGSTVTRQLNIGLKKAWVNGAHVNGIIQTTINVSSIKS